MIEIVSPGNKSSRVEMDRFVHKSVELIRQGCHLLVVDLFPPSRRDPEGIHGLIWSEINSVPYTRPLNDPLTLVSYVAGDAEDAYIEPTAVGNTLVDMPLFLDPDSYVNVPLEKTYMQSFQSMPPRWKSVLEA